jgi:hypothetical protein
VLSPSVIHTSHARNAGRTRTDKERSQWFEPTPPTIIFIGYQALSQDLDPQSNPHLSDFAAPTAYRLAARRDILVAPPESPWTEANHQVGSEAQIVSDIVHATTENWRRFSKSTCPVRTDHVSFVLNHLECSHLRRITLFADYCAPLLSKLAENWSPTSPE